MNELSQAVVAGLLASFACGLGVLPLLLPGLEISKRVGLAYGFAGGLMFAASVYNLLLPAFAMGPERALELQPVCLTLLGLFAGSAFLWMVERAVTPERLKAGWFGRFGGRASTLVFLSMTFHSIPEGVAVGVGYGSASHHESYAGLGLYIALAIAIHNIPEGLAVALPLRAEGASITKCFWLAVVTSLPQPLFAIPATLAVWFFEPLMLPFLGFAAGAMMFLVVVELIPDALETRSPEQTAWSFMIGFGLMTLVQVAL